MSSPGPGRPPPHTDALPHATGLEPTGTVPPAGSAGPGGNTRPLAGTPALPGPHAPERAQAGVRTSWCPDAFPTFFLVPAFCSEGNRRRTKGRETGELRPSLRPYNEGPSPVRVTGALSEACQAPQPSSSLADGPPATTGLPHAPRAAGASPLLPSFTATSDTVQVSAVQCDDLVHAHAVK